MKKLIGLLCVLLAVGCGEDETCAFDAVAPGATVIFVPATIAFGASAGYGFVWANRCSARQR